MHRTFASLSLCLWALAGIACSTPTPHSAEPAAALPRPATRIVGVLPQRLNPPHLVIGSEERLAWLNYTNRDLRISLDPSALPALRCEGSGSLKLDRSRLTTERIVEPYFATGCQLTPGEYAYRVERLAKDGGTPEVIHGSVVVVPQAALAGGPGW